jgi:hypothetical protein
MTRRQTRLFLVSLAVALFLCGCAGKKKVDDAQKQDYKGACECALKCAQNTLVDDPEALVACQQSCQTKFGGAMVEGTKRAMEVMTEAREGCAD